MKEKLMMKFVKNKLLKDQRHQDNQIDDIEDFPD